MVPVVWSLDRVVRIVRPVTAELGVIVMEAVLAAPVHVPHEFAGAPEAKAPFHIC